MPEKELPADWMIKRALEVLSTSVSISEVKRLPNIYYNVIRCAHYIGEHESEPVDPDLLLAREAAATCGWGDSDRDRFLAGAYDHLGPVKGALRAIKLARERGAL